ncbi:uncharacterized protein LOC124554829 [Schistocerca americana]|uniref:uncharacterized protein LOC124554829 n=1 Tax=Schistocerca americana TaxID=7009 RepID=UPI001F4F31E1|nr:uncharacterized protein LOC124554829 [Schistocerca americana]XP_047102013.1 uncharacterized protein LOC124721207 [Schistocerca piceifrons]XP_049781407.1 uncharacterized protein LOC126183454 [Schistocerca cancellata]XP_049804701.1 uncharacterized protein LOC126248085 [Schistocerca nitens]XP_049955360.1 uncharacterized protein LOC126471285 [Schistocerca serialis cubense]
MEAGVLRVVVLVALFLLLTADYSTLLAQLLTVLGSPAVPAFDTKPAETALAAEHESWELYPSSTRAKLLSTIKNSCLPKLICEMNAMPSKEKLTESEKALLNLIRDTSISVTAEVTSRYHFAAHMGQLIAGVDGAGCHNFYPNCPFPGLTALQMIKSARAKR